MSVEAEIHAYLAGLPAAKREALVALHARVLAMAPDARLWFLDGRDASGKVVTNPNIGYGEQAMMAGGGKTRDFYRVGLSANTGGISVYIMGLADKTLLARVYGARLGKAAVTGYCIKFRSLSDIDMDVLDEAIRFGLNPPPASIIEGG